MSNVLKLALTSLHVVRDPNSPIFDSRVEIDAANPDFAQMLDHARAKVAAGKAWQQTPVTIVTRENMGRFGIDFPEEYLLLDGRQRRHMAEILGTGLDATVKEIGSLSEFFEFNISSNTLYVPETLESQIQKCKLWVNAGATPEEIATVIKFPGSTLDFAGRLSKVKELVKFGDPTKTAAPAREMMKSGELEYGAAKQVAALPPEQQKEIVSELAKVQNDLLTAAIDNGKLSEAAANPGTPVRVKTEAGDTGTVTVDKKGNPKVKPSQDTTMKAKAKVQNKAAPESTKSESDRKPAATAKLDTAIIGGFRVQFANLARMTEHNYADIAAGGMMLAAMLLKEEYALPEGASEELLAACEVLAKAGLKVKV